MLHQWRWRELIWQDVVVMGNNTFSLLGWSFLPERNLVHSCDFGTNYDCVVRAVPVLQRQSAEWESQQALSEGDMHKAQNWFSATDEFFPGNIYIAYMVLYHMIILYIVWHLNSELLVGLHSLDVFTVNVLSEWMVSLFLKSVATSLNWENFRHTAWQRQTEHSHGVNLPPCRRRRCAGSSENVIR